MRYLFYVIATIIVVVIVALGIFWPPVFFAFIVFGPLLLLGLYDVLQRHNSILRNFPVIGHLRYFFELIAPEIQQYFIERHTDGTPLSRNHREIVYKRSIDASGTHPFGTELNLYDAHYEGLKHSMYPIETPPNAPRVHVGGPQCTKPYDASLLNISAMSFGALSPNAILAMNKGAKIGHFYHNTGEGGLSDYHLQGGGDITWQIGTAYFGCRTEEGRFDPDAFRKQAVQDQVKMIELKMSQGAKPGHGGVLPATKNNAEIARIRMVEQGTAVISPPGHREFSDAEGMLHFIAKLRELCGGKPVGFKLCIGRKDEFLELCQMMKTTGIQPDFITVDGAEGGTGAAPLEYSDSVGMPLEPALIFVHKTLTDLGLKDDIRIIASGKVLTAASLIKMLAYGADLCNSARAFMLSVGCIQAQRCDTNTCPTGVTTQNPMLYRGLVVEDKKTRVANFHKNTLKATMELMAATGITDVKDLTPELFLHGSDWRPLGGPQAG